MNKNLLNILSNSSKDIDNQKLMDYLEGKLSAEEAHEVEQLMAENDFMNDALEGLNQVQQKTAIPSYLEQINRDLKKRTEKKQARKGKRKLREHPWIYLAIITILALIIFIFYVLHNHYKLK